MSAPALSGWLAGVGWVALAILGLAMLLALWRIVTGPSPAERVVGMELMGLITVSITLVMTLLMGQSAWVDVAIAMVVFTFVGTIAVALYLLRE